MTDDPTSNARARASSRQTLPKSARVCSRADFDRVFRERNRASDAVLTVYVSSGRAGQVRLGIAASRSLGNAVRRNRVKRLIREAFRRQRASLPPGTDWVVVPRRADAALDEVDASFGQLIKKLVGRLCQRIRPPDAPGR